MFGEVDHAVALADAHVERQPGLEAVREHLFEAEEVEIEGPGARLVHRLPQVLLVVSALIYRVRLRSTLRPTEQAPRTVRIDDVHRVAVSGVGPGEN